MSGLTFTWACIMGTLSFFAYMARQRAEKIPVQQRSCDNEGRNAAIVVSWVLFAACTAATVGCLVGSIFA